MAMPETDLLRIGRWCRERVPEHLWDQVRVCLLYTSDAADE